MCGLELVFIFAAFMAWVVELCKESPPDDD